MVPADVYPEVGTSSGQTGSAHEVQTVNWRREDTGRGTVGKKDNQKRLSACISKGDV